MNQLQPTTLFFLLICGHAIGDFAIQTEWVAINKNRHARMSYPPEQRSKMQIVWPYLLTAHAIHHGLIVFLITQKISLALAEIAVHWTSDFIKCEGWYGFHADQFVHLVSKILWTWLFVSQIV